jgi:hypothetical protein
MKRSDSGVVAGIALIASSILVPHVNELRDPGEICATAYIIDPGSVLEPTLAHLAALTFVLVATGIQLKAGKSRRDGALIVLSGAYLLIWSLGVYSWLVKTCFRPALGSGLALGGFVLVLFSTLGGRVRSRLLTS